METKKRKELRDIQACASVELRHMFN